MDQRPVNEIKVAKLMKSPSSGEEKSSQISNISFLILCNPICIVVLEQIYSFHLQLT